MDCGTCTLCCTLLTVKDIDKPAGMECEHCTGDACSIYDERPQGCRDFCCAYSQMEQVNIALRPDNCGVVFEKAYDDLMLGVQDSARDTYPHLKGQVNNFLQSGTNVILIRGGKPTVISQAGVDEKELLSRIS